MTVAFFAAGALAVFAFVVVAGLDLAAALGLGAAALEVDAFGAAAALGLDAGACERAKQVSDRSRQSRRRQYERDEPWQS